MDVVGFFVMTGEGVYYTHRYVMDVHHAMMDLMKEIVVRFIYVLTCKKLLHLQL